MKENKYDDAGFFEAYSNFPRSVEGLRAAGEWHVMKRMLPSFRDKRVLDIGCGFGWHCFYAAEHGADRVLGTDISEKMLAVAREKNVYPSVGFRRMAMEELTFEQESFDVVISSLAFHYTPIVEEMFKRVHDWLSPGGSFVFSVEHPVFTADGSQQWAETTGGKKIWPVDNYFHEGAREADFLGHKVIKYHRTLTAYLQSMITAGLIIKDIEEPQPEKHLLETVEGMSDELRRPMMLIISAGKPLQAQC